MPPDPLKLKQWGGIIYEYQEHLSSDHLKEIARSAMGALAYVAASRGKVHIPPEK